MHYVKATALISSCERYRYDLKRVWHPNDPMIVWVMLNPSTADGKKDDPTVKRVVAYSRRWGYGGCVIVNLFAFRSTDPRGLNKADDPVGPGNDYKILEWVDSSNVQRVMVAWGNVRNQYKCRARIVLQMIKQLGRKPYCLGLTVSGDPKHPVRLSRGTRPLKFRVA